MRATREERNGLNVKMFVEALIELLRITDEETLNWITDMKQLWRRYIGICFLGWKMFPGGLSEELETQVKEWDGNIYADEHTLPINNENATGYAYLVYLSQKNPEFIEFLRNYHKRSRKQDETGFPTIKTYKLFKSCNSDALYLNYIASNVGLLNKLGSIPLRKQYTNVLIKIKHIDQMTNEAYHMQVAKTCLKLVKSFQKREAGRNKRLKAALGYLHFTVNNAGILTLQDDNTESDPLLAYLNEFNTNAQADGSEAIHEMLEQVQTELVKGQQRAKGLNRAINKRKKANITIDVNQTE